MEKEEKELQMEIRSLRSLKRINFIEEPGFLWLPQMALNELFLETAFFQQVLYKVPLELWL